GLIDCMTSPDNGARDVNLMEPILASLWPVERDCPSRDLAWRDAVSFSWTCVDDIEVRSRLLERGDDEHIVETHDLIRAIGHGEEEIVVRATSDHMIEIRRRKARWSRLGRRAHLWGRRA